MMIKYTEQTNEEPTNNQEYVEYWYQRMWRPSMAALYMFLCLLDYGIRPMVNYYESTNFNLSFVVETIVNLDPIVQIEVLQQYKEDSIEPILTEFVHLAFGAILGISAFSRGSQKAFNEGTIVADRPRRKQNIDNPDEIAEG